MKTLPLLFAFSVLSLAPASVADVVDDKICDSGICVVEFNASFNSQNSVEWIEKLNDCETSRVTLCLLRPAEGAQDCRGSNHRCISEERK